MEQLDIYQKGYFSETELTQLADLNIPISKVEYKRIQALRETNLLDSKNNDPRFDKFTSLAQRIFNVSPHLN